MITHRPFQYLIYNENIEVRNLELNNSLDFIDGVTITPFTVPHRNEDGNTIGLEIKNSINNKSCLYITDIDYITNDVTQKINSTNLVSPAIPTVPQLKKVKEIEFFDQIPLIMPKDLVINNNQRPFPIPD